LFGTSHTVAYLFGTSHTVAYLFDTSHTVSYLFGAAQTISYYFVAAYTFSDKFPAISFCLFGFLLEIGTYDAQVVLGLGKLFLQLFYISFQQCINFFLLLYLLYYSFHNFTKLSLQHLLRLLCFLDLPEYPMDGVGD